MDVQDIIKTRRLQLGLTMKDVADYVRVSEGTVSRWESGNIANMKRNNIYLLAKILNVSPLVILGGETDVENPIAENSEGVLDAELVRLLVQLSPAQTARVLAFVQGMLAADADGTSAHK